MKKLPNPSYTRPARIVWLKEEDNLILHKWGLGMKELRRRLPGRSTSDIYGRRVQLLKGKGVAKL